MKYHVEAVMSGKNIKTDSASEAANWILSNPIWTDKNLRTRKPTRENLVAELEALPVGLYEELSFPFIVKKE